MPSIKEIPVHVTLTLRLKDIDAFQALANELGCEIEATLLNGISLDELFDVASATNPVKLPSPKKSEPQKVKKLTNKRTELTPEAARLMKELGNKGLKISLILQRVTAAYGEYYSNSTLYRVLAGDYNDKFDLSDIPDCSNRRKNVRKIS